MPDYTSNQLIVLMITLFLGGILQSTVGFGYALLCIPIFVAGGIPLNEAVIIIVCSAFFQSLYTFYKLRKEISIKKSFLPASIRIITLWLGIAILSRIKDLPKEKIQLIIGIAVFSLVLILWFWKPKKKTAKMNYPFNGHFWHSPAADYSQVFQEWVDLQLLFGRSINPGLQRKFVRFFSVYTS